MGQGEALAPVTAAWAKEGRTGRPHPLVCHAMDTAAVAELLYPVVLGPFVRAELEKGLAPLGDDPARWVAVLCGVHDLGKLMPVFQAQCLEIACSRMPGGRAAIERAASALRWKPRMDLEHGLATALHLSDRLQAWGASRVAAEEIACALGGHHGWIPDAKSLEEAAGQDKHFGGSRWTRARDALIDTVAMSRGLPPVSQVSWKDVRLRLPAAIGLAGLTTLCDWIASDRKRFRWQPEVTDALAYAEEARQQADRVVSGMRWSAWRPANVGFEEFFGERPRSMQEQVAKFVADRNRPGVLVLEAPTGEGKTKAALSVAALLVDQLGMSGLYVGMPTQATGNKVYWEVTRMLLQSGSSLVPVLAHSAARHEMTRQDRRLVDAVVAGSIVPKGMREDADPSEQEEERKKAREFFRRDSALAAPIGVGTMDQAVRGVLRAKRSYMHFANLSGKVIVLDEVHGYEVYTDRLIDRFMWFCGRLGIPVVLLSATLPVDRREDLLREWQAGANDTGTPPLESRPDEPDGWQATWVDGQNRECLPLTISQQERTVAIEHLNDLGGDHVRAGADELVNWVFDRLQDGGSAMILLDTRARAARAFDRVQEEVKRRGLTYEVVFIVSKKGLKREVRQQREQRLYDELGNDATGERKVIAVGTQVLENLDIDVDLLVSDLCPTDRLIQRIGRLHRYELAHRPARVAQPTVGIAGMRGQASRSPSKLDFPTGVARVHYRDLLEATWRVMSKKDSICLPEDVPALVHHTYVAAPHTKTRQKAFKRARRAEHDADVRAVPRSRNGGIRDLTERPGSPRATRKSSGPPEHEHRGQRSGSRNNRRSARRD